MTRKTRQQKDGNHGAGQDGQVSMKKTLFVRDPDGKPVKAVRIMPPDKDLPETDGMPWAKIPRDADRIENIRHTFNRQFLPAVQQILTLPVEQLAAELPDFCLALYHEGFVAGSDFMNDPRSGNTGPRNARETKNRQASEEQKDRWIAIYQNVRADHPNWSKADCIKECLDHRIRRGQGKHTKVSESSLRNAFKARGLKME